MKKSLFLTFAVGLTLVFASCASKKNIVKDPIVPKTTSSTQPPTQTKADAPIDKPMVTTVDHLKKIIDNGVSAKNIVTDMTFNIKIGSKDISVPGSLRMRRDEVIRLQLFVPLLGTEVGRIEFSPDRVLIVNRLHKEYIEADYTQLDFLKNNDLNFYSLQALFWNQLAVPGKNGVDMSDFAQFNVDGTNVKLTRGNMTYNWTTAANGQIVMTNINYASASSGASSLLWMYSNFRPLGVGQFPLHQDFQFTTTATKKLKTVK
ncbi:MAG: DUF4292 domain-containing protein, partial [Prevotella sp.]|nr:DUF4292 domain-containing protein [Prevotella sp.]